MDRQVRAAERIFDEHRASLEASLTARMISERFFEEETDVMDAVLDTLRSLTVARQAG